MKWNIARMAIGVMVAIAVAITSQTSAAMSESDALSPANMSAQSEDSKDRIVKIHAEPILVQARPPVAERAMWMMFDSGGKPIWALLMGGMMLGGAAIMASSSHDDDHGHGTEMMPVMMAVVGTGMLIYYFSSDDVPRKAQTAWGEPPQASYALNLDLRRDAVRATAFWRW